MSYDFSRIVKVGNKLLIGTKNNIKGLVVVPLVNGDTPVPPGPGPEEPIVDPIEEYEVEGFYYNFSSPSSSEIPNTFTINLGWNELTNEIAEEHSFDWDYYDYDGNYRFEITVSNSKGTTVYTYNEDEGSLAAGAIGFDIIDFEDIGLLTTFSIVAVNAAGHKSKPVTLTLHEDYVNKQITNFKIELDDEYEYPNWLYYKLSWDELEGTAYYHILVNGEERGGTSSGETIVHYFTFNDDEFDNEQTIEIYGEKVINNGSFYIYSLISSFKYTPHAEDPFNEATVTITKIKNGDSNNLNYLEVYYNVENTHNQTYSIDRKIDDGEWTYINGDSSDTHGSYDNFDALYDLDLSFGKHTIQYKVYCEHGIEHLSNIKEFNVIDPAEGAYIDDDISSITYDESTDSVIIHAEIGNSQEWNGWTLKVENSDNGGTAESDEITMDSGTGEIIFNNPNSGETHTYNLIAKCSHTPGITVEKEMSVYVPSN